MFMEDLHLSFREVYEEIPYPLLIAMSSDKPRPKMEKKENVERVTMSGREMMARK